MTPAEEAEWRLQVALRMKAARFLAGSRATDGRQAGSAIALTVADLAALPVIVQNGIKKNRIEDIEQMTVSARPMELEKIAEALGVPSSWFSTPSLRAADDDRLGALEAKVSQLIEVVGSVPLNPDDAAAFIRILRENQMRASEGVGRRELQSRRALGHSQESA